MGPVSEAEAKTFYDENAARLPKVEFEEVKGQIIDLLAARRQGEAMARLREGTQVEVLIEAVPLPSFSGWIGLSSRVEDPSFMLSPFSIWDPKEM